MVIGKESVFPIQIIGLEFVARLKLETCYSRNSHMGGISLFVIIRFFVLYIFLVMSLQLCKCNFRL